MEIQSHQPGITIFDSLDQLRERENELYELLEEAMRCGDDDAVEEILDELAEVEEAINKKLS